MSDNANLAAALVAALSDLTVVEKGRTAKAGAYSYDYADIADVVKLTRPVLKQHGLVALTPVHAHEGELACTVILLHVSGERMDFDPFPFPHGKDAQATGSMVTYHRRYALVAALGMAAGDDDDGAAAAPRQRQIKTAGPPTCPKCQQVIAGEGREPMRAHLVADHGFVRQDDGTVVAPKPQPEDDPTRPFSEVGA